MLLKVCDNDKFDMQPSFSSICCDVYTCGDTERIHETERMQTKYLKKTYCCHYQKKVRDTGRQ